MQNSGKVIMGLCVLWILFSAPAMAEVVDNDIYAALLKKHVKNSHVNYDGFKEDEPLLDRYLEVLSRTPVSRLSRNDQFAFYINAYNASTIKLVLTKYPGINSIKEIGSFFSNAWNKDFILLEGRTVSLDYIEHQILRPVFKDPRVHFAINCASKSCPPLRDEPYDGGRLENQLNDQAKSFINNTKNTFIKQDTLFVSRIFKWFEDDFSNNPLMFIRQYASEELKQSLDRNAGSLKLSFLDYDWSLNR